MKQNKSFKKLNTHNTIKKTISVQKILNKKKNHIRGMLIKT